MKDSDKENEEALKLLRSISGWMTFFGVVTILGVFGGVVLFVMTR